MSEILHPVAYPATLPKPPPNTLDHQLRLLGVSPLPLRRVENYKRAKRDEASPLFGPFLKDSGWGGTIHAIGSALIMFALCVGGAITLRDPSFIKLYLLSIVVLIPLVLILQAAIQNLELGVAEWQEAPLCFEKLPHTTSVLLDDRVNKELMPPQVRDLIEEVHLRVPQATLWIEELGADPILYAECDGVTHALIIWEERRVISL